MNKARPLWNIRITGAPSIIVAWKDATGNDCPTIDNTIDNSRRNSWRSIIQLDSFCRMRIFVAARKFAANTRKFYSRRNYGNIPMKFRGHEKGKYYRPWNNLCRIFRTILSVISLRVTFQPFALQRWLSGFKWRRYLFAFDFLQYRFVNRFLQLFTLV